MEKNSNKGKKRITFQLKAEPGSEVFVAGDFNGWEPNKKLNDRNNDGNYKGVMLLDRQKQFEYKFVINGQWSVDPDCEEWVPNAMGSLNSILKT